MEQPRYECPECGSMLREHRDVPSLERLNSLGPFAQLVLAALLLILLVGFLTVGFVWAGSTIYGITGSVFLSVGAGIAFLIFVLRQMRPAHMPERYTCPQCQTTFTARQLQMLRLSRSNHAL